MKKILTIPLIFLVLFSGISINVAAHFCGGMFVMNKVSLSGELASCGMDETNNKTNGDVISGHSCENILTTYTLSGNFMPSEAKSVDAAKYIINTLSFPLEKSPAILISTAVSLLCNRPPGNYNPYRVKREVICVFRI